MKFIKLFISILVLFFLVSVFITALFVFGNCMDSHPILGVLGIITTVSLFGASIVTIGE